MNTEQTYKAEELCTIIVCSVPDKDGKGSTQLRLRCERELEVFELALLDEVLTDTIEIQQTLALRAAIQRVQDAGYIVDEA